MHVVNQTLGSDNSSHQVDDLQFVPDVTGHLLVGQESFLTKVEELTHEEHGLLGDELVTGLVLCLKHVSEPEMSQEEVDVGHHVHEESEGSEEGKEHEGYELVCPGHSVALGVHIDHH